MKVPGLFGIATIAVLAAMLLMVISLAADLDLSFALAQSAVFATVVV